METQKTLLFVYNRKAGKDRIGQVLADILQTFTEQGYLVTTYPSQAVGDVRRAVCAWGAGFDRIVIAGGDGTLNEAVTGSLDLPVPPLLGYLPTGTTNDFSRNLHLPTTILRQAKLAATGEGFFCDVGRFQEKPFIYVAAFGAFAEVSFSTPQRTKNLLGYTAYLLESMKRLPNIKPIEMTVELDGECFSGSYLYGMVSNTKSVGGLTHFPPGNPSLNDGLLEVTLISPAKDILELEKLGRNMLLGNLDVTSPMLHSYTAKSVKIFCEDAVLWSLDGENGGLHKEVEISVLPHAFQIVQGDA